MSLILNNEAYILDKDHNMKGTYDVHTNFHYSFEDPNYVNKARERGLVKNLEKKPAIKNIIAVPPKKN